MRHAVAFVFFVAAIVATPKPDPVLKIAVNSTTIESLPLFAAAGSGIQLVPMPNGRAAMAALLKGEVDAATGSETQALLNSVAEPRLRIVLTLAECRYRIVARRSSGIRRAADLRGKSVAVTLNTSSYYYLSGMLRRARVDESTVKVVGLEGQEMPAALDRRTVDAVSIWEPHAQNSLEMLGKDAVVLEDPSVYTERFNLNTRTDVLADPMKRAALVRLVQAIQRVSVRTLPSLASNVGLTERAVMAVWPQFKFPASLSGDLRTVLNEVEPWVASTQNRQPRSSRELAGLIDASLLSEPRR